MSYLLDKYRKRAGVAKTSLIWRCPHELKSLGVRFAVVEGDLEGEFDSRRIERQGIPALQITTGRATSTPTR